MPLRRHATADDLYRLGERVDDFTAGTQVVWDVDLLRAHCVDDFFLEP